MTPKSIGIDARLYYQSGVGVYLRNLLYHLHQSETRGLTFHVFVLSRDVKKIADQYPKFNIHPTDSYWHSVSEQWRFYHQLMRKDLGLMHFTYFSYPVLYSKKFIATVHDLTPLLMKTGRATTQNPFMYNVKYEGLKFILRSQVANAQTIITPSEAVRNQLLQQYAKIEEKTVVFHEGVNYELIEGLSIKPKELKLLNKPFFIYVGNFYPHKNVEQLLHAWNELRLGDFQLVLIGPENIFSERLKQEVAAEKIMNVAFHHSATTSELSWFYSHAAALINPSLSEGFGLPLVEAAHYYLPVIASNLEVFRELLGGDYYTFDPSNKGALQQAIKNFVADKNKKIPSLPDDVDFSIMTKRTLEIYRSHL